MPPRRTMADLKAEIASLKERDTLRDILDLRVIQGRAYIAEGYVRGAEYHYKLQAAYSDVQGLQAVRELAISRDGNHHGTRFYLPDAFKGAEAHALRSLDFGDDRLNAEAWLKACRQLRDMIATREKKLTDDVAEIVRLRDEQRKQAGR